MMASAATNLFDAESFIGMTLGGGSDKAGRSAQILSKAFPFATPALNIRISPITIHAASANGVFLEIEDIRFWHPIQNLTHRANGTTTRADQRSDSLTSLRRHVPKVLVGTDKYIPWPSPATNVMNLRKEISVFTRPLPHRITTHLTKGVVVINP